jgi:hypothetical protein
VATKQATKKVVIKLQIFIYRLRKEMSVKTAAALKIKQASKMSKQGKKDIAQWLRKQATALIKDGHLYHDDITIRYQYIDKQRSEE